MCRYAATNLAGPPLAPPLWKPSQGYQLPFISWPQRRSLRRLRALANHIVLSARDDVVGRDVPGFPRDVGTTVGDIVVSGAAEKVVGEVVVVEMDRHAAAHQALEIAGPVEAAEQDAGRWNHGTIAVGGVTGRRIAGNEGPVAAGRRLPP